MIYAFKFSEEVTGSAVVSRPVKQKNEIKIKEIIRRYKIEKVSPFPYICEREDASIIV